MPYDVELIRDTTQKSPFEERVVGLRVTGLPEEYFGEETSELFLEETEDGTYHAFHDRTRVIEFDHLRDAVASALTELWRGHPVPSYGAGDAFVLRYGEDGEHTQEFVASSTHVFLKHDWEEIYGE